jgi:flagellar hook-length control protein FliK
MAQSAAVQQMPIQGMTQSAAVQQIPIQGMTQSAAVQQQPVQGMTQSAAVQQQPIQGMTQSAAVQQIPIQGMTQSAAVQQIPIQGMTQSAAVQQIPIQGMAQGANVGGTQMNSSFQSYQNSFQPQAVNSVQTSAVQIPAEQTAVTATVVQSQSGPLAAAATVQAGQITSAGQNKAPSNPMNADVSPIQVSGVQAQSISAGGNTQNSSSSSQDGSSQKDSKHDGTDAYSFLSGIAQQSSVVSANTPTVSQADKTNVTQQMAGAVKQAVDSGRQEVRLHLSPEDLGGISIRIVSQGGQISLHITADNAHTGQLIESSMHELTQSIQNQGLSMGKAEVGYSQTDTFGGFSGFQQQSGNQSQQNKTPVYGSNQNTAGATDTQDTEPQSSGSISILA